MGYVSSLEGIYTYIFLNFSYKKTRSHRLDAGGIARLHGSHEAFIELQGSRKTGVVTLGC